MKNILHKRTLWFIILPVSLAALLVAGLPVLLNALGLNRPYPGRSFNLPGRRALVITTSHDRLGEGGKPTGVYASELTVAYYQFLDAGMQVDVASMQGGRIPFEPASLRWPLLTPSDRRYLKDADLQAQVQDSLAIAELDFSQYDLVYLAGGWGAAYDLGTSQLLGEKFSAAYAAQVVLGSVCHGALGFLQARDEAGNPLVQGRHLTAVTDKQVLELGIGITPQHPERELRQAGALFESSTAFRDVFASHVVVDGRLVTGQNQNDAAETAQRMLAIVERQGD